MAVDHRIIRNSENFKGLDKRTSDLKRSIEFATDIKNAAYRISGAINKRKGFRSNLITNEGGYGMTTFKKVATDGSITDELLLVNNKLRKLQENNITFVNYSEDKDVYINIIGSQNKIDFELLEEGTSLLTSNLGSGLDTSSKTLGALKSELEATSTSTLIFRKEVNSYVLKRLKSDTTNIDLYVKKDDVIARYHMENPNANGGLNIQLPQHGTITYTSSTYDSVTNSHILNTSGSNIIDWDNLTWDTISDPTHDIATWTSPLTGNSVNGFPTFSLVDNVPNLTLSATSQKAALLEITASKAILRQSEAAFVKYNTITDVVHGDTNVTNIFSAYTQGDSNDVMASQELENTSFAQLNNVLYISNGIDRVMKYDGNKVYRAGLPGLVGSVIPGSWAYEIDTDQVSISSVTSENIIIKSNTSGADRYYKFVIEYTDAMGNVIFNQPSDPIKVNIHSSSNPNVDIHWNTSIFNHLDLDNTKLKIRIYRTNGTDEFGLYYEVSPVAGIAFNNDTTSTFSIGASTYEIRFNDTHVISSASDIVLADPVKRRDPPPKGKYLTVFKNCLISSGNNDNVNNLQYSLASGTSINEIGSEYFPDDDNGTVIESSFGDRITSIAALRDLLFIFHKNSIHVLAGNISEPEGIPYTVDLLTKEGGVGCQSHASVVEFRNQLLFLSETGYFTIDASTALNELSDVIKPFFLDKELKRKRAVSFNWVEQNVIIMMIPKEAADSNSHLYAKNDSLVVVYDYFKNAWLQWDNLNVASGISLFNEQVYFTARQSGQSVINSMNNSGTTFDYMDHHEFINFEYDTNWESLQDPTIPKKFLRLKLHSQDTDGTFESPSFEIDLKLQTDYLPTDLGSILLDFGKLSGNGWGDSSWSNFPWGNVPGKFIKTKLPTGKSKCLKLRFTNKNDNENVLITNYEMEVATPYKVEIKD